MFKIIKPILIFLLIPAILYNINLLQIKNLSLVLGLFYLLVFGLLLGKTIFKDKEITFQLIFGVFTLISLYSLLGAIIYYFYKLDLLTVNLLFAGISILVFILNLIQKEPEKIELKFPKIEYKDLILTFTYLILFFISLFILWQSQTAEAIRTPWQAVPKVFFIIYLIATINLILLLIYSQKACNLILISLHFFLTTSVALIIYKLGYGFDPFIHQVTEKAIFENGLILPKPFYYLGQYSLVVFLAHLLQISYELIDKLLLPALFSLFLPYTIYFALNKTFNWSKGHSQLLTLTFLFLPFGLFIVTNPQALANLFSILILFLSFLYLKEKQIPFWILIVLALTALSIHALAGLPIFIYLIILWLIKKGSLAAKIILSLFVTLSIFLLPLALLANSFLSIYKVNLNLPASNLIELPNIFTKQYNYFFDLAYLYRNSIYLIFILIALITFIYLVRQKNIKLFIGSLLTFLILIINAVLLSFINVSYIIDYEQGEFSQRVFQVAFYFLLPIVIYGLYLFFSKALAKNFAEKTFVILIIALAMTFSLYLSYPRFDDYNNSKFINLSEADLEAVKFIEANSQGQPYIVLANQMTAAAALKTFGFTKYYNNQYFYPIPTGGPLYKYFEKMIYETPTKQTMLEAMDFANVKIAYFALPSYWSRFKIISEEAKNEADSAYSLEDKILIFKYWK